MSTLAQRLDEQAALVAVKHVFNGWEAFYSRWDVQGRSAVAFLDALSNVSKMPSERPGEQDAAHQTVMHAWGLMIRPRFADCCPDSLQSMIDALRQSVADGFVAITATAEPAPPRRRIGFVRESATGESSVMLMSFVADDMPTRQPGHDSPVLEAVKRACSRFFATTEGEEAWRAAHGDYTIEHLAADLSRVAPFLALEGLRSVAIERIEADLGYSIDTCLGEAVRWQCQLDDGEVSVYAVTRDEAADEVEDEYGVRPTDDRLHFAPEWMEQTTTTPRVKGGMQP